MFLFGGIYFYMRATKPVARGGRDAMVIFGLAMLAVQGIVFFGPPPASDRTAAVSALLCYSVFVGVDYWLETKRSPVSVVQELSPEASRR